MARVTVEDCLLVEPNRFKLILAASERVKQLDIGEPALVDHNNKNCVVALREIGERCVDPAELLRARHEPVNEHYRLENSEAATNASDSASDIDVNDLTNDSQSIEDLNFGTEFDSSAASESMNIVELPSRISSPDQDASSIIAQDTDYGSDSETDS